MPDGFVSATGLLVVPELCLPSWSVSPDSGVESQKNCPWKPGGGGASCALSSPLLGGSSHLLVPSWEAAGFPSCFPHMPGGTSLPAPPVCSSSSSSRSFSSEAAQARWPLPPCPEREHSRHGVVRAKRDSGLRPVLDLGDAHLLPIQEVLDAFLGRDFSLFIPIELLGSCDSCISRETSLTRFSMGVQPLNWTVHKWGSAPCVLTVASAGLWTSDSNRVCALFCVDFWGFGLFRPETVLDLRGETLPCSRTGGSWSRVLHLWAPRKTRLLFHQEMPQ